MARDGQNTPQLLDEAINRLPSGIMTLAVTVTSESCETVRAESIRVGSMFVNGDGRVMVWDRIQYLAMQAKTNGSWDKNLTKARREV